MGSVFKPDIFLNSVLPKGFFSSILLTRTENLKPAYMQAILLATSLSKREVNATVNKTVDFYDKKMKDLKEEGDRSYRKDALHGTVLLRDRIEGLVLYNEVQELKEEHEGEFYEWLPSEAETPDPEHQLLYGKVFRVGEGDKEGNMPCERYGCKCGIRFLTKAEAKELKGK